MAFLRKKDKNEFVDCLLSCQFYSSSELHRVCKPYNCRTISEYHYSASGQVVKRIPEIHQKLCFDSPYLWQGVLRLVTY